ncbi:TPA: DUF551 domain-containing protein [Klebsiella pneumoniae]
MTSKLTRERIQRIIRAIDSEAYDEEEIREWLSSDEIMELSRMALAAMDSEPVAIIDQANLDYLRSGADADVWPPEREEMGDVLLYRHAQPAPVVPNGLRLALSNAGIAAPESDEMLAATCEKHIQALVTWVRDRKPFQSAPVVMDDRKLRSLFDSWFASDCSFDLSPEASEEDNIAWRESYWYVWQRCRAAMLQAGNSPAHSGPRQEQSNCSPAQCSNSPAIPDGYVLVPREPTEEMNKAGWAAMNEHDAINPTYRAMIAAAPQLPGSEPATVPGKWVPVSDRMPETDGNYWGWWSESKRQGPVWFIKSELQAQFQSHEITHWMPLPADPQEVK